MKKILPSFLIIILFIFVVFMWLTSKDLNEYYRGRIDWYLQLKTPSKCESIVCQISEPEIIYREVVKRNCKPCDCSDAENQAQIYNEKNMELL